MTTTTTTKGATTMDTTTSIIVSKIEKLWRKANSSGATAAEREVFEAKALSLMEENRITLAMLDVDGEDLLGDYEYGSIDGRYVAAESQVLTSVAYAYDCRIWWRNRGRGSRHVFLFGFKSDTERVELLARMLIADAFAQAAQVKAENAGRTFAARRSFILGYASAISLRLREAAVLANKAIEDAHGEPAVTGASLVLVDRRKQVHAEYSKKRLRTVRTSSASVRSAYTRGYEAGTTASLSTQSQVATRKALAS